MRPTRLGPDLTLRVFGCLRAVRPVVESRRSGKWHCVCECGERDCRRRTQVTAANLVSLNTKSCGAARARMARETLARKRAEHERLRREMGLSASRKEDDE